MRYVIPVVTVFSSISAFTGPSTVKNTSYVGHLDTPPPQNVYYDNEEYPEDFELVSFDEYGNETDVDLRYDQYLIFLETQSTKDSFYNWLKRFRPHKPAREVMNLVDLAGREFYLLDEGNLCDQICASFIQSSQKSSLSYSDLVDAVRQRLNHHDPALHMNPFEQIWVSDYLEFTRKDVTNIGDDFRNPQVKEYFQLLLKVPTDKDSSSNYIRSSHPNLVDLLIDDLDPLTTNEKCRFYFQVWHKYYCNGINDSLIYKSIQQLESLTHSSKDLSWQERATWYVALAKMYASMQYVGSYSHRSFDHYILGYLKRASSIVYSSKTDDYSQKWLDVELMRALFWSSRIEIVYKLQAFDICSSILNQSEIVLSDKQISKVYCYLGYSLSKWIQQAIESENIVPTPEHNLWLLMAILNSKWYPEDEFIQQMNLASLAVYFNRYNKYQESRACHYQQLVNACNQSKKGIIDNPLFNFYYIIEEIQQDALNLRLKEDYIAWGKFLNPYFDLDAIPYTKNTIGRLLHAAQNS